MGCGPSRPSGAEGNGEGGKKSGGGKKAGGGQAGGDWGGGSHELQSYDPIQYESDRAAVRALLVTRVHFVAQTILQIGGNHWAYTSRLVPLSPFASTWIRSEVLGAQAPNHGYRGRLYICRRDQAVTHDQQMIVTIPPNPGHSVGRFIDVIINEGNHLYDFTTRGRGCTGWILDQFILFQQQALIASGYNLAEAIAQQWEDGHATKEIGVTHGTYMRDTTYGGWAGRGALRRR